MASWSQPLLLASLIFLAVVFERESSQRQGGVLAGACCLKLLAMRTCYRQNAVIDWNWRPLRRAQTRVFHEKS